MTPTERRQRILAATCEGCAISAPIISGPGGAVLHIFYNERQEPNHAECTANALADEVQSWLDAEYQRGRNEALYVNESKILRDDDSTSITVDGDGQ